MSEQEKLGSIDTMGLPQAFGHPKGLIYLFFAELWERFSFYGMRALLTLYMVNELYKDLANGETKGLGIYAAYGALVYATPLIGGYIADKLIGYRKSIMLGAALMTLGHFIMAFESEFWFFSALGLLIVGNGFFKPNISSLVGTLYSDGDVRRDAGFTIFYMSINIGAFLAPLICGWLAASYGWHYGFGAAGIGMFIGLLCFQQGSMSGVFGDNGLQPQKFQEQKYAGMNIFMLIIIAAFVLVPVFSGMVYFNEKVMGAFLWVVLALVGAFLLYYCFSKANKVERERIFVIIFITVLLTVFWSFFEQAGSSLTLFAERNVDLKFINAAQTNSINPGWIVLLAIPFASIWTLLTKRGRNPRTPYKYALGIAQLGLGFLLFAWSAQYMSAAGRVPMFFLLIGWFFVTTGELFVSPIGLSKITELAPKHMVAFFFGVFFLSSAFAHHIAGIIAKLTVPAESKSEVYVPKDDIFTKFGTWVSGNDQNKVGEFEFNFNKHYGSLVDTMLEKNNTYPSMASLDNYIATINNMESFPSWKEAASPVKTKAAELKSILGQLLSYPDSTHSHLKKDYHRFTNAYLEVQKKGSAITAYDNFKKREAGTLVGEDFDKAMFDVSKGWQDKAEERLKVENELKAKDPQWAKTVMDFHTTLEANKQQAKPIFGLSLYSKIFSQIALISFIIAFLTLLMSPIIKRWMHGIN